MPMLSVTCSSCPPIRCGRAEAASSFSAISAASFGGGEVDKAALVAVLGKAAAVDRSRYTAKTLVQLDEAVAVGEVVVAGSRASAKDVQKVTKGVEKALKQLREPKVKKQK